MARDRNVSVIQGLRYQGQVLKLPGFCTASAGWASSSLSQHTSWASFLGGEIGKFLNNVYVTWWFQIFVIFCALFHGINGLRITIMDLWPKLIEYQREAIWVEWFVLLPVFGVAVIVIINTAVGG